MRKVVCVYTKDTAKKTRRITWENDSEFDKRHYYIWQKNTAYLTKQRDSSSSLKVECRASIFDSWGNPTKDAMGSIGLPENGPAWIVGEIWWDNYTTQLVLGMFHEPQ